MGAARVPQHALPLQVAAVCYRRRGPSVEFMLVNTNGGGKWTFPKGDPESSLPARRRNAKPAKKPASAAALSPGISASTSIQRVF